MHNLWTLSRMEVMDNEFGSVSYFIDLDLLMQWNWKTISTKPTINVSTE